MDCDVKHLTKYTHARARAYPVHTTDDPDIVSWPTIGW